MTETQADPPDQSAADLAETGVIIARPSGRYRLKWIGMSIVVIAAGFWFGYDGYKAWPAHNERVRSVERQISEAEAAGDASRASDLRVKLSAMPQVHSEKDLALQRLLAMALPPLGLAALIWTLYVTRGQYRMEGEILHVPGHPPVSAAELTNVDQKLWQRKGIAFLDYTSSGRSGRIRLDDFRYERVPTDRIFDRIVGHQRGAPSPAE